MNGNIRIPGLIVAFSIFVSAFVFAETAFAQKRDKNKAAVLKQGTVSGAKNKIPAAAPAYNKPARTLFDDAFAKEILDIPFVENATDEVEYTQIYKPFSESVDSFGKNLSKAVKSSNDDYASFVNKYAVKFKSENDFAAKKMRVNRDPNRVESLKSIFNILKDEHKKTIENEREKIKARFESLFLSFSEAYQAQKRFMLKNTSYEAETSELGLALGSFEAEIKEKDLKIKRFIDSKFSKFEAETLSGEKNGDL